MIKKILFFIILVVFTIVSCKVPILTAIKGSVLVVSVSPNSIAVGGEALVKVIGYKPSGTPLPDGTIIFFSATMGEIDESAEIKGGIAIAKFKGRKDECGVAEITVSSGGAESVSVQIKIGVSSLSFLSMSAEPKVLGPGGGYSDIVVRAYNKSMLPLQGIPLIISSDKGSLDSKGNILYTDENGKVKDRLYTEEGTSVYAKSGEISAQINIEVKKNEGPTASFVFSPSNPEINQYVYFNASESSDPDGKIVRYEWDFGDGRTGKGKRVSHMYEKAGTYNVTLTVYDEYNKSDSISKTVTVEEES